MSKSMKQYILMHKNIPVADFGIDLVSGAIVSVGQLYEKSHVPVGIPVRKSEVDRCALNEWWRGRTIPASRMGIRAALMEWKLSDTQLLAEKCFGLSLSDQYWICPAGSGLCWEQIHFFEHDFSEDVGNILFGKVPDSKPISLMSPDNTTDGWLKKRWVTVNGKHCLMKGGSGATWQEPYNEVLASRIMERLHIPHVSYDLLIEDDYPYSICEDFITSDTELISAWCIMQTMKKPNHISVYRHYMNCCKKLGIHDVQVNIDQMIALDYLIVNEDRHLNNFGVIRRADTLEYLGPAPIYDSGTSLWFDKPYTLIHAQKHGGCKPFKNSHEEQIKLVTDFDWLNFSALAGVDEELREIVRGSLFVDDARCKALCRGLNRRIEMLEKIAISAKDQVFADSTQFDVIKNTAYSGEEKTL